LIIDQHTKFFIIGLTLTTCINSHAIDLLQIFKEGNYKVDFTPLQIGVVGNLFATKNVCGFSFALPMSFNENNYGIATGIWGKSKNHYGLQANMLNRANVLNGVQIGLIGILDKEDGTASESSGGIQMNILCNIAETLYGFQGGLYNQGGRFNGMQLGLINAADQCLQIGMINIFKSQRRLEGYDSSQADARVQIGIYNHSNNSAFQVGALNYCKNSLIPIFPLFNFSID